MRHAINLAAARGCGECSLCCKVMGIAALDKPAGAWCRHCKPGTGCAVYGERPGECRSFNCLYLIDPRLGEEWKPSRSKIVLVTEQDGSRIVAHVDPQRPNAWRQEPYYRHLKKWAEMSLAVGGHVMACVGRRTYVIFPDREVDLGDVGLDEFIVVDQRQTPFGVEFTARKTARADRAG